MRAAGNFHPEWGYFAPVPSFVRKVRILLISTAIGATAGTVVVTSLVTRLHNDDTSISARALFANAPVNSPAPAAPVANTPATAPAQPKPSAAANAPSPAPTAAIASTTSAVDPAALAGTRPAAQGTEALALTPAEVAAGMVRTKKSPAREYHWVARNARNGWRYDRGSGPFFQPAHRSLFDEFRKPTSERGSHFGATRDDW